MSRSVPTSMPSPIGPSSEYFRDVRPQLSERGLARQRESQRGGRVPEVGGFTGQSVSTPSYGGVFTGPMPLRPIPSASRYQPNRPPVGRSEYDDPPPSVQPRGHPTLAPPLTFGQYLRNIGPFVASTGLAFVTGGGSLPLAIGSGLFGQASGSSKAILDAVRGRLPASDQQIQQQQQRREIDVVADRNLILRQTPAGAASGGGPTAPRPPVVTPEATTPRLIADQQSQNGGAVTPDRATIKPAPVIRVAGQTPAGTTQRGEIQFGRRGRTSAFVENIGGTLGLPDIGDLTRKKKRLRTLGGGRGLA